MSKRLPVVGDIISSPEFAFGYRDIFNRNQTIAIDGVSKTYPVTQSYSEEERVAHAAKTGKILPKTYEVDYGAYDESRGKALFVVERAVMEGGATGVGMNGHDDYPDELHVTARRLTKDGHYNRKGEVIHFYFPDGCFSNSVTKLNFHGKMKIRFE